MATKKTWTYGASLTSAERRAWNRRTDEILRRRTAKPLAPHVCAARIAALFVSGRATMAAAVVGLRGLGYTPDEAHRYLDDHAVLDRREKGSGTMNANDVVKQAPPKCPDCGGELSIERDVVVDEPYFPTHLLRDAELPRRKRVAYAAAFCCGCEFAVELDARGRMV